MDFVAFRAREHHRALDAPGRCHTVLTVQGGQPEVRGGSLRVCDGGESGPRSPSDSRGRRTPRPSRYR
jgi:hypothetical protein